MCFLLYLVLSIKAKYPCNSSPVNYDDLINVTAYRNNKAFNSLNDVNSKYFNENLRKFNVLYRISFKFLFYWKIANMSFWNCMLNVNKGVKTLQAYKYIQKVDRTLKSIQWPEVRKVLDHDKKVTVDRDQNRRCCRYNEYRNNKWAFYNYKTDSVKA